MEISIDEETAVIIWLAFKAGQNHPEIDNAKDALKAFIKSVTVASVDKELAEWN